MMILNLERKSSVPFFKQIIGSIRDLIDRRVITPGYRMPSTRLLAEKHNVSRSTVIKAYEDMGLGIF